MINLFKRRHEKFYKNSKFHLIADVVLLAIIIFLAGSLILIKNWPEQKNVFLDSKIIENSVVSGKNQTIEIRYANKNKEEITDGEINIFLPENFMLDKAIPNDNFNRETMSFVIGNLPSGANGSIKLSGTFFGEVGTQEKISFVFDYKKKGEPLNALNTLIYPIEKSAIETGIEMTKEMYSGGASSLKVTVKNNGDSLSDATFLGYDSDLWLVEKEGKVLDNIFNIGEIKVNELKEINLLVTPKRAEGMVNFSLISYLEVGKNKLIQQKTDHEILVKQPKISVSLNLNKSVIKDNETAFVTLDLENQEGKPVTDLAVLFISKNKNFKLNSISVIDNQSFKISGGNKLLMAELKVGESKRVKGSFKLERISPGFNDEISVSINNAFMIDKQKSSVTISSSGVKAASDLKIRSLGYYYGPQGDQLGVGPLPPTPEIPTSYWIFWQADNAGNELNNLNISAQLPENVFLTGNKSLLSGELVFDNKTRKINWKVPNIDKVGGNNRVGFEISVLPHYKDVGKELNLLTNLRYEAYDAFINADISGLLKNITTNLEADPSTKGKSKVAL